MQQIYRVGKEYLIVSIGAAIVLGIIVSAFNEFSRQCYEHTYSNNKRMLQESSEQNIDAIQAEFKKAEAYVVSAAAAFACLGDLLSQESFGLLDKLHAYSGFKGMWLVSLDGRAYSSPDISYDVSYNDYFQFAREGKLGVTYLQSRDTRSDTRFCVYAPVTRDGIFIGAVLGVFELGSMVVRSVNPKFDSSSYIHVFDRNGALVLKSGDQRSIIATDNLWLFFRSATFERDCNYEEFHRNVQDGASGVVHYQLDGLERIGYFAPLGVNEWYILSAAPREIVSSFNKEVDNFAAQLVMKVFLCFAALTLAVAYFINESRLRLLNANHQLNVGAQRFRIAAYNSSNAVVEFDVAGNAVRRIGNTDDDKGVDIPVDNLATGLIDGCVVDDESLPDLENTLEQLRRGVKTASCIVKAERIGSGRGWFRLTFTNIFVEDDIPVQAVGTVEDITVQKEAEIAFTHKERHRQAMMGEVLETFVFNVSKGRYLYGYQSSETKMMRRETMYTTKLDAFIGDTVHPDYREAVTRGLSADNLRRQYDEGRHRVELVFRATDADAGQRWLKCTTNLVVDPDTEDLMGYAYVEDVTKSKLEELALRHDAEQDALTGLYNRNAANRLMEQHLRTLGAAGPEHLDAFLIIDMDRFKYINDTYGHAAGDEALRLLADKLRGIFRASDIVGRMGGDEFMVFMKNARSEAIVRERADSVCRAIRAIAISADPRHRLSGSVGACVVRPPGMGLEAMYGKADLALYAAKNKGKDAYAIYHPAMEKESAGMDGARCRLDASLRDEGGTFSN